MKIVVRCPIIKSRIILLPHPKYDAALLWEQPNSVNTPCIPGARHCTSGQPPPQGRPVNVKHGAMMCHG